MWYSGGWNVTHSYIIYLLSCLYIVLILWRLTNFICGICHWMNFSGGHKPILLHHVCLKPETIRILMLVKQCLCLVSTAIQEILGDQMPIISCTHGLITLCMTHRPVWWLSKTPSPYCQSAWKSCIWHVDGAVGTTHMLFGHNCIWPALVQSPSQ